MPLYQRITDLLTTLTFSEVADFLSVIGFLLTIWVLVTTFQLKNGFRNRIRGAELYKSILEQDVKLLIAYPHWETDKKDTLVILRTLRSQLESLKNRTTGDDLGPIKLVIQRLKGKKVWYRKARPLTDYTKDEIFEIHVEVVGVAEKAKQNEIDANWS